MAKEHNRIVSKYNLIFPLSFEDFLKMTKEKFDNFALTHDKYNFSCVGPEYVSSTKYVWNDNGHFTKLDSVEQKLSGKGIFWGLADILENLEKAYNYNYDNYMFRVIWAEKFVEHLSYCLYNVVYNQERQMNSKNPDGLAEELRKKWLSTFKK